MQQRVCDAWQAQPRSTKYRQYEGELLAVYEAIKYSRHMVEGRPFVTFTGQKPLTYAFQQRRNKCSPRQFRHLELIGQICTDFRTCLRTRQCCSRRLNESELRHEAF
jgi:hypothetical protein